MKVFKYKAINKNAKTVEGTITSSDTASAQEALEKTGLQIINIKASLVGNIDILFAKKSLTEKELIAFFSSISALDRVGIDVLRALNLLKEDISPTSGMKAVCAKIYQYVSDGESLSQACKKSSTSFTDDFVGLIAIAEKTGTFASVFDEITEYIKWNSDVKNKAKKAIRGPVLSLIFMIALIMTLSVVVVPKILLFLDSFQIKPPIQTIALIAFSNFIRNNPVFIGMTLIGIPIGIKISSIFFARVEIIRDRLKLFIPIFGNLLLKLDTSRFIAFFNLMYNSGADMLTIIDGVSKVVNNKYLGSRIMHIHRRVIEGDTIFRALDEETIFPILFRKMMAICEETGDIAPVLNNVKYFYDRETKDAVDRLVETIKPTLTIFLGAVVMWIGSATLGPIYGNIANIADDNIQSSGTKAATD